MVLLNFYSPTITQPEVELANVACLGPVLIYKQFSFKGSS